MMMVNNVPIHFNPINADGVKKFSEALMKVTQKTARVNGKLVSNEITEKKFEKKQKKIIKNFFKDISSEDKALMILEDCETLDDYIKIFAQCMEEIKKISQRLKGQK